MEIREATPDDSDAIRSIAHDSLRSTYTDFIDEATVDEAVNQWYDDEALTGLFESEHAFLILAVEDGDPVAFSQSELVGEGHAVGRILWLHVVPDARGHGIGVRLLVRTREELRSSGADEVRGLVLEDNEGGNRFYAEHGFDRVDTREVEIGNETFREAVYVEHDREGRDWRGLEPVEADGETLYVSYAEMDRGSKAPFYSAYEGESGSTRYGWFCGNCDSLDNAMDTMGRVECNSCGNARKATRWDASYL